MTTYMLNDLTLNSDS